MASAKEKKERLILGIKSILDSSEIFVDWF